MLNPQQTEIFLANLEDFLLTRGMFYSPKTYPGLEEFANNLDETIIGQGLIPQKMKENFWECLLSSFSNQEGFLTSEFLKSKGIWSEAIKIFDYASCLLNCRFEPRKHIFECLTTEEAAVFCGKLTGILRHSGLSPTKLAEESKYFVSLEPKIKELLTLDISALTPEELLKAKKDFEARYGDMMGFYREVFFRNYLNKFKEKFRLFDSLFCNNKQNTESITPPNFPSNQERDLPTNSQASAVVAIPPLTESAVDKPPLVEKNLAEKKSKDGSSEPAKFLLLSGVIIFLFLVGTVILIKRKRL